MVWLKCKAHGTAVGLAGGPTAVPWALLVVIFLGATAARADDAPRWTVEALGTTLGDVTNRHVVMGGATVGVGYRVFGRTSLLIDGGGYGFSEGRIDGVAAGVTVGLRQHLLDFGRFGLDADVSGGILGADRELPYNGTHFNETIEFGPAVTYRLSDGFYLLAGVRYFHLSNADRQNAVGRNPSVNAVQGVLGVEWRF